MRGGDRSRLVALATLGAAGALFLALFAPLPAGFRSPDAIEYRAFANALRSGELLAERPVQDVPRALLTRTPGYPVLLVTADLLVPRMLDPERALHLVIGMAGLLAAVLGLRGACPPWITAAIVLSVQWQMRRYFAMPLTEWTCFNGLLALFAILVRTFDAPSLRRIARIGLLCALLILTRPALLVVIWVPVALAWLQPVLPRARATAAALAPLALLLLWMAFNLHRMGAFTITPFAGMNAAGVAMLVGHAAVEPDDGRDLRELIRGINEQKQPPPGRALDFARLDELELKRLYNDNVHVVAEGIVQRHGWDRVTYDRMLLVYAGRAMRSHPAAYAAYVWHGLARLAALLPWLPAALLLPVFWLVRGRHRALALGVLVMLAVHVVHVTLCAVIELVIDRYYDLTAAPLEVASLVALAVLARDLLVRLRGGGAVHEVGQAASARVGAAPLAE